MRSEDEPRRTMALFGPPLVVAACIFCLYILPYGVLAVLIAWTLASFPIGVLIGHCVLSEERSQLA